MAHKPPPPGYICYRCGQKGTLSVLAYSLVPFSRSPHRFFTFPLPAGHWIQECPTNGDAAFDNRPRIKRTTGIPKSFLTEVAGPSAANPDEEDVNVNKSGIMVTADGGFVVARPDKYVLRFFAIQALPFSIVERSFPSSFYRKSPVLMFHRISSLIALPGSLTELSPPT
jgi:hypothetical protein